MSKLLLVIDFINDIVHPEGKRSSVAPYVTEHQVIQHANQAISFARSNDIDIVHVKVGFNSNYKECPTNSPLFSSAKKDDALLLGTWGTEFHKDLDVQESDTVIVKHRVSALYATPLETILRASHVEQVYVCGVSTNMAIETVTRELHDRDYQVVVIQDACGAANEEVHKASLFTLSRIATVCNAEEL